MSKKKKKQQQQAQAARSPVREVSPSPQLPSRIVAPTPSGAALVDEGPEPATGDAPVPVLLLALLALLVFLADVHLINRGGEFDPKVYYPYYNFVAVQDARPKNEVEKFRLVGRQVFKLNCEACHQATGQGLAGQFPALAGSEWVIGESPNRTIRIVLSAVAGPIDVKGDHFDSTAMPAWKLVLNDEQVAAVVTFIRTEWGNKAGPVTPDQVKKIRDLEKTHDTPWTTEELKKIPDKE
jgi:mono/diheme cytochrome c family protein